MKNQCFLMVMFLLSMCNCFGQNGISIGSGSVPDNSAILDLQSTTKGFIPPKMSSLQRKAITSPAAGLIVFDTDLSQLYLYDGISWQPLVGGGSTNALFPNQVSPPAADQKSYAQFGIDVDIYGNYAVIGAPGVNNGTILNTGAIYVYKKSTAGSWLQVAKLYASDSQLGAYFGASVAINGNYIVVGSPAKNVSSFSGAGKIYVFVKGTGDTWTEQTNFTKTGTIATNDYFGYNVDISTTTASGPAIIVGCPYADIGGTDRGAAFTYRFNGTAWVYVQTLIPIDIAVSDYFGYNVTIDGDYCAVSAPYQDNTASFIDVGAIYIFVSGGGVWTQQQKLSGYTASSLLGFSLSLQGDKLAAGAPLAIPYINTTAQVSVYQRSGASWSTLTYLYLNQVQGFDVKNYFGISVALDGENLLISLPGGYLSHSGGSNYYQYKAGYVAVYKFIGSGYFLQKIINDNDPIPPGNSNFFGNAVSSSNGNYIIGIPGKVVNGYNNVGTVALGFLE